MAFISASLLAEPPLISLFDDEEKSSSISPVTGSPSPGSKNTSMGLKISHMISTPTKDLMEFEEKSPADKLYSEIYQKNLLKFLSSGGFAARKKDIDVVKEETTTPSLIDEQPSTKNHPDNSIDKHEPIIENVSAQEETTVKVKDDTTPPTERKQTGAHGVDDNEKLLCLSDEIAGSPINSSEDDSARSSHVSIGPKKVHPVHVVPKFVSATSPKSLGNPEKLINTADLITTLSDVVTSDYLAGESSSSEGVIKPKKRSYLSTSTLSTTRGSIAHTRRLVRINFPHDILHTMQEDPRFDGVCHAWVRRPDFCKFGVNCDFNHEYPPVLAKKYGLIAVYVGADGREIKGAEEALKLEDVFTLSVQNSFDQGAKIHSPGCYNENCRAFLRNDCIHGDKCWYKHPKTVIEDGKWVTKDIRKLVSRKDRASSKPNGMKKVDTSDGSWGDRQSSISPTDSSTSGTRLRITSKNGLPHSLAQKAEKVDIIHGHNVHKVTNKGPAPKPTYYIASEEENEGDINSDALEGVYYPGSACVARAAAKLAPTKSVPSKVNTFKPSSTQNQVSSNLRADIKSTARTPTATNSKPSPSVPVQTKPVPGSADTGYNYWGDETVVDDGADYWKNAPSPKVSRMSSRQQALIVEAMTYDQLFREEPCTGYRQEYHRSHRAPRGAQTFVLPPQPAVNHRETQTKKLFDAKLALAQAKQDKEVAERKLIDIPETRWEKVKAKETLIDILVSPESTLSAKASVASQGKHSSVLSTQSINDGYETSGSGSDWTKSLKAMLAQKCEPIKWSNVQTEPKLNTLIEF